LLSTLSGVVKVLSCEQPIKNTIKIASIKHNEIFILNLLNFFICLATAPLKAFLMPVETGKSKFYKYFNNNELKNNAIGRFGTMHHKYRLKNDIVRKKS